MKYLAEYMEDRQSKAFAKAGAFFAFSNKQFDEAKQDGIEYTNIGAGLICDKTKAATLIKELETIYKESIAEDIKDNGKSRVILRELNNHEAYYTRDITNTVEALKDYPLTAEDIIKVFRNKNAIII